jgi:hypothetical protein
MRGVLHGGNPVDIALIYLALNVVVLDDDRTAANVSTNSDRMKAAILASGSSKELRAGARWIPQLNLNSKAQS